MINKYQGRNEGLKIWMVFPSDEPNPMGHNRNMLLYSYEGSNKVSDPGYTKKMILLYYKEVFVYNAQVIVTSRDKERKLGLYISRISTDFYSNIIGRHRNKLLPDKGRNTISKIDPDKSSKPDLGINM